MTDYNEISNISNELYEEIDKSFDNSSGCKWLLDQNFKTMAPYTIEEAYELLEAVEKEDMPELCSELGDLLYHIVIYAQLAKRKDEFSLADVFKSALQKHRVRRSPSARNAKEAQQHWQAQKQQQRRQNNQSQSLMDVPEAMPALMRAAKLQIRAARVGFDWADPQGAANKLREELEEFEQSLAANDEKGAMAELGDILFTCVNLSRHMGSDAELALRKTNEKFSNRFKQMELLSKKEDKTLSDLDLQDLNRLWDQAKQEVG